MNQSELNEILRKHKLWLEGEKGGQRANFSGSDLKYADLRYANFSGADLSGADLRYADLKNANFSGSDLKNASLSGADLSDADLSGADLSGADIDFSCLPLRCESLRAKWDKKHIIQFLYHAVAPCYWHPEIIEDDEDLKELMQNPLLIKICIKFHRQDSQRIEKIKEESNA